MPICFLRFVHIKHMNAFFIMNISRRVPVFFFTMHCVKMETV
ncbi:Hypothetical protein ACI5QL_03951 [Bacillus velezensis]